MPGPVDKLLERIGGTVYSNCYSPAPDSPRSLACLYTGSYPQKNHCDKRIKWPKYYLNNELETIFGILLKNRYKISLNLSKVEEDVGFLPSTIGSKIQLYHSPRDIRIALKKFGRENGNFFDFVTLSDYHWSMDEYGHNSLGDYLGQKHISNYLNGLFDDRDIDSFDYTILFSDHGFQLDSEMSESNLLLTNDKRSKITMFVRKKGDVELKVNNKLSGIIDILPTIASIVGEKTPIDCEGISLFDEAEHDSIVIEDHKIFGVKLDQVIENWSVRTNKYFYFTNLVDRMLFKVNSAHDYTEILSPGKEIITSMENHIEMKSAQYVENKKQHDILRMYQGFSSYKVPYSDGVERVDDRSNILFRLKRRMARNRYKRW